MNKVLVTGREMKFFFLFSLTTMRQNIDGWVLLTRSLVTLSIWLNFLYIKINDNHVKSGYKFLLATAF